MQNGIVATAAKRASTSIGPIVGVKRKRTFRSCVPCRDSKVKCSGERPVCLRCQQRRTSCVYDAEQNEPAWVQSISTTTPDGADNSAIATTSAPQTPFTPGLADNVMSDCPPSLTWYVDHLRFSDHS